jgi:hypothetical protein
VKNPTATVTIISKCSATPAAMTNGLQRRFHISMAISNSQTSVAQVAMFMTR